MDDRLLAISALQHYAYCPRQLVAGGVSVQWRSGAVAQWRSVAQGENALNLH